MKLIKADNYQSWYLENLDNSMLIDPWLTNSLQPEDSFFIQRNKDNVSVLGLEQIKKVNAIIITAPFEDHLHFDTIRMFPEDITIYTSNIVKKVLLKNKINNPIKILDEKGVVINSITVRSLPTSYPYYRSTFSILFEDQHHNTIFHEGHRVNFRYLVKNNIKADVAILAADETKLFGFIQLGMNYKNTLKATKLLESKELFITGNNPEMTKGFIKNFLLTKTFNINEMLKTINVSGNEGDSYTFK
jgi:L-ascorbate metabolism protein UlaG (beta-lactamase superfamily)